MINRSVFSVYRLVFQKIQIFKKNQTNSFHKNGRFCRYFNPCDLPLWVLTRNWMSWSWNRVLKWGLELARDSLNIRFVPQCLYWSRYRKFIWFFKNPQFNFRIRNKIPSLSPLSAKVTASVPATVDTGGASSCLAAHGGEFRALGRSRVRPWIHLPMKIDLFL
jgi:hypothetical protein